MTRIARTLALALASSVALSSAGCASRAANGATIIAGGMVLIKGVMVGAESSSSNSTDTSDGGTRIDLDFSQQASVGLVVVGLGLMAAGGIGLMGGADGATHDGVVARHAGPMGTAAISESDRLGMRAARAASAGDCATVRLDVAAMHAMDPEYASALVAHDAQISACMDR